MSGHTAIIRCLKIVDLKIAVSDSGDMTLRIWDIETGICRHILTGHQGPIRCLEVSGKLIVSGSNDGNCKVWICGLEPV